MFSFDYIRKVIILFLFIFKINSFKVFSSFFEKRLMRINVQCLHHFLLSLSLFVSCEVSVIVIGKCALNSENFLNLNGT